MRYTSRGGSGVSKSENIRIFDVTFDGATAIIYRMGEEVNRGAFSFGSKTDAQVVLGGSNNANLFNGALDDVRIYNSALSPEEVAKRIIYNLYISFSPYT